MPFIVYGSITNYDPRPPPDILFINSISGSGTYQTGTSTTDGVTYKVYAFTSSTTTPNTPLNTITYTSLTTTQIFVLAVAGGGGAGGFTGGGGGAGGVVMTPVILPVGTNQTITLASGSGGVGSANNTNGSNGYNTIITFSNANMTTITALGGGGGGSAAGTGSGSGASSGGGSYWGSSVGTSSNANMNYGTPGGIISGGGGGAGTNGTSPGTQGIAGNGGNGIQCFLPGIKDYTITSAKYPSGVLVSTLYWGGGGGAGNKPASNVNTGMGGLGGGGGGGNGSTSAGNYGKGGAGLNDGIDGSFNNGLGGPGGTNTGGGGGGGGDTASSPGGTGGSGIVIIAFPIFTTVTQKPGTPLTAISTSAYNYLYGAYGCKLLNYNYYGPIFTLRSTADTTGVNTKNFYTNTTGTSIGDQYLGTGTSLSSWLTSMGGSTSYAYVSKWYDQSMDNSFNCATQYDRTKQPIYEISSNPVINTGYNSGLGFTATGCFFDLPIGALPYGDTSYNITTKHYNGYFPSTNFYTIVEGGTSSAGKSLSVGVDNLGKYCQNFYSNDFNGASGYYAVPTVVTFKYNKGGGVGSRTNYIHNSINANYTESNTSNLAVRNSDISPNYICKSSTWVGFNGQISYIYIYGSVISDADRIITEAT